ncbi:hypothetical protein Tco_1524051 [Tanacetum coccineum]
MSPWKDNLPKLPIKSNIVRLDTTSIGVKNILKYLRNTKDMFLVYGENPSTELRVECYCNAGFKTDRDDTKSQIGYVFVLNGGAVDWKSSKQRLGIVPTINEPINMYCDNSAAVHYANEPGVQRGARTTLENIIMFARAQFRTIDSSPQLLDIIAD